MSSHRGSRNSGGRRRGPRGNSNRGFTDTGISGANRDQKMTKKFQKWSDSNDGGNALEDQGGIGNWDQFETNRKLYGVESTYDENLYTTKLDKSGDFYQKNLKKADDLARNIMGADSANPHVKEERGHADAYDPNMDEEDKYSGVIRGSSGKYVPPGKRQGDKVEPAVEKPMEVKEIKKNSERIVEVKKAEAKAEEKVEEKPKKQIEIKKAEKKEKPRVSLKSKLKAVDLDAVATFVPTFFLNVKSTKASGSQTGQPETPAALAPQDRQNIGTAVPGTTSQNAEGYLYQEDLKNVSPVWRNAGPKTYQPYPQNNAMYAPVYGGNNYNNRGGNMQFQQQQPNRNQPYMVPQQNFVYPNGNRNQFGGYNNGRQH